MEGNPLALVFLLLAVLLFGLTILFIVLQKRMLSSQAREVRELLAEAQRMAAEGSVAEDSAAEEQAVASGPHAEEE